MKKANSFINERLKTLEAVCNQLHKDNIVLKKENEELKASKSKHMSTEAKPSAMTVDQIFETYELANETEWILKQRSSPKKRKEDTSPTVNSLLEKNKGKAATNDTKTHRPPTMMINDVKDFNNLH